MPGGVIGACQSLFLLCSQVTIFNVMFKILIFPFFVWSWCFSCEQSHRKPCLQSPFNSPLRRITKIVGGVKVVQSFCSLMYVHLSFGNWCERSLCLWFALFVVRFCLHLCLAFWSSDAFVLFLNTKLCTHTCTYIETYRNVKRTIYIFLLSKLPNYCPRKLLLKLLPFFLRAIWVWFSADYPKTQNCNHLQRWPKTRPPLCAFLPPTRFSRFASAKYVGPKCVLFSPADWPMEPPADKEAPLCGDDEAPP